MDGHNLEKMRSNQKVYTYDEAVDLTGHGRYSHLVLITASIMQMSVSMDMFGFSVTVAAGECDLQLELTQIGALSSIPFAGVFFALPWGYFADTRGRRKALLLSTSVGFLMAALSSFATNWQILLVFKLVGCFFSTASYTLAMTYLGECTNSNIRYQYAMYMSAANLSADCLFYILAYFILPLDIYVPIPMLGIVFLSWRLYTLVVAMPLGLGALMMFLLLKESPKFLASRGHTEEALDVLIEMYRRNGGNPDDFPVKVLISDRNKDEPKTSFWNSIGNQTMPLFKQPLLWRTLQLFFLVALAASNNNFFLMWYPEFVDQFFTSFEDAESAASSAGFTFCERIVTNFTTSEIDDIECNGTLSQNTIIAGIITGLVFGILNLAMAILSKWRRWTLIGIFSSALVCIILTNIIRHPLLNLIIFTLIQDTALGIGLVLTYFVDMYPTSIRAMATSLSMMVTRGMSVIGVNLIGVLIAEHCMATFYSVGIYVAAGIVVAMFLPPDQKMRQLQT